MILPRTGDERLLASGIGIRRQEISA